MTLENNNVEILSDDVSYIEINNKKIWLIGTAHISQDSAQLVKEVIEKVNPDRVCIELDEKRYKAITEKKKWETSDIKTIIKEKQLTTLLINIVLASYQKKMGEKLGTAPGVEFLEAINVAKEMNIPIELCDRDARITLKRTWNSMSFWQKLKFMFSGLSSIEDSDEELSEEKLNEIKQKDTLNNLLQELGKAMPVLKRVLIDERDIYLATKIMNCEGEKIVAVVGAGHVSGMLDIIKNNKKVDIEEFNIIPPVSPTFKIIGWAIPAIIILSIVLIGYWQGTDKAFDNALIWILANGIPSAIGALIAFGHPLTILSAFIAAPFTSLTPLIGAGYVAAFVQFYYKTPLVADIQTVTEDVQKVKMWWKNKLLRIFLVFILSSLGSALGTYVGAFQIISNIF